MQIFFLNGILIVCFSVLILSDHHYIMLYSAQLFTLLKFALFSNVDNTTKGILKCAGISQITLLGYDKMISCLANIH